MSSRYDFELDLIFNCHETMRLTLKNEKKLIFLPNRDTVLGEDCEV